MSKPNKVLFFASFGFSIVFWVLSLVFDLFSVFNLYRFFTSPWFLLFIPYILFVIIYAVVNEVDEVDGTVVTTLGFWSAFLLVLLIKWMVKL